MLNRRLVPATDPICLLKLDLQGADSLPSCASSWLHGLLLFWPLHKSAPRKFVRERGEWGAVY